MSNRETLPSDLTDWREREFVTFKDAGRIVGRSYNWARDAAEFGYIEEARIPSGGPRVITVRSLQRFIDHAHVYKHEPQSDELDGPLYEVDKGVPLPKPKTKGAKRVYPWGEMDVGDSFLVTEEKRFKAALVAPYAATERYWPKKFVAHRVEEGVRVWRVE